MGDTKDNQKPSTERKLGLMDRVKNMLPQKKHDKRSDEDTAKNFIDHIEKADECITKMIQTKETDLDKEKGQEVVNQKKVALLHTQLHHLEQIAEAAIKYQDL